MSELVTATERERLGRIVRKVWVDWAKEQPNPKPSWLQPWEELSEPDREVDRRIGERLYLIGTQSLKSGRGVRPLDNGQNQCNYCGSLWTVRVISLWWPISLRWQQSSHRRPFWRGRDLGLLAPGQVAQAWTLSLGPLQIVFGPTSSQEMSGIVYHPRSGWMTREQERRLLALFDGRRDEL
jgi:hypothetical protein